jgi:hypothetical protein
LIGWLEEEHGFSRLDAYQFLTQAGGLYVGNMVDTTYSLVASVDSGSSRVGSSAHPGGREVGW